MASRSDRYVSLRFRPLWVYIEGIREFCAQYCQVTFGNPELVERFRIVSHEALENAVRLSADADNDEVTVELFSDGRSVVMSVTNSASRKDAGVLKQELEVVYQKSPSQSYSDAIGRALATPDGSTRLGLARMRAEGQVDLELKQDGGRIQLVARATL